MAGKPNPIELQKALKGADYPSDPKTLASLAEKNGADSGVVERISHIRDKRLSGPDQVQKAVFDQR